jgi:hypothetical protein
LRRRLATITGSRRTGDISAIGIGSGAPAKPLPVMVTDQSVFR